MPNYKPQYKIIINLQGVAVPFNSATDKMIWLYKGLNFGSSYKTMETPDGVDYQVPTGKKAIITDTGITGGYNANALEGIYSTTAADADTGKVELIVNPWKPTDQPCYIEIAEALYITAYDTGTALYGLYIIEAQA